MALAAAGGARLGVPRRVERQRAGAPASTSGWGSRRSASRRTCCSNDPLGARSPGRPRTRRVRPRRSPRGWASTVAARAAAPAGADHRPRRRRSSRSAAVAPRSRRRTRRCRAAGCAGARRPAASPRPRSRSAGAGRRAAPPRRPRLGDGRARPRGGRAGHVAGRGSRPGGGAPDAVDPHLGAFARVRAAGGLPGDSFVLLEPVDRGPRSRRRSPAMARVRARCTCGRPRPRAWAADARARGVRLQRPARRPARRLRSCSPAGPCRPASRDRRTRREPVPRGRRRGYHRAMNDAAQLTIRPATDGRRRSASPPLLTDEGYPAGPSDLARRIERFAAPDSRVLVAEQAGEVLGLRRLPLDPAVRDRRAVHPRRHAGRRPGRPRARDREGAARRGRAGRPRGGRRVPRGHGRATTARTRASCSSPWATTPPSTTYLRKRP